MSFIRSTSSAFLTSLTLLITSTPQAQIANRCDIAGDCIHMTAGLSAAPDDEAIAATSGRPCPDTPGFVRAAGLERRLMCSGIKYAHETLAACGIYPRTHVYAEIADEVFSPSADKIFARFDRAHDTVMVTSLANLAEVASDTPYASLPLADFFVSMVVHETTHAIIEQNQVALPLTRAAQEYPAYAMQIAALPPASRDAFLKGTGINDRDTSADIFSDTMLMFDPYYFAAQAYTHFISSQGGCKAIHDLIKGHVAFIAPQ